MYKHFSSKKKKSSDNFNGSVRILFYTLNVIHILINDIDIEANSYRDRYRHNKLAPNIDFSSFENVEYREKCQLRILLIPSYNKSVVHIILFQLPLET